MKNLVIKIVNAGAGPVLALCDEAGEMLPGQVETTLACIPGEPVVLTVKFYVDGQDVRLEGD